MNKPLLSILIPTVPERIDNWNHLLDKIFSQSGLKREVGFHKKEGECWGNYWQLDDCDVEVISFFDEKVITIGEKRELMYRAANGFFSWQIDDDDDIAEDAIPLILEAIKQEPDCITFEEHCLMDGKEYCSNHSIAYGDWEGDGQKLLEDGFHFHRTPFMKSVIKTSIAQSIPIPHIRFGEDHQWAQALKPHLKTEVHIPKQLYFYQHISSSHNERYGII